jgi:hypothetical protein
MGERVPTPLLFDAKGKGLAFDIAPRHRHWSQALAKALVGTYCYAMENHIPMEEARYQLAQKIRRRLTKKEG